MGKHIIYALLLLCMTILILPGSPAPKPTETMQIAEILGESDSAGFERAFAPRSFNFPTDHGPHPTFKHEWWYVTGNLESTNKKRKFGFQWTLFRIGLTPTAIPRSSAWAATNIYMGHMALTDIESGRFYHFQKLSRPALQMAGAEAEPFKVWIQDWQLKQTGGSAHKPTLQLKAMESDIALDLTMKTTKKVVLQGDNGLSQKSQQPGNASYYYSLPRLQSSGTIRIGQQTFNVAGLSWLDREWSTSALSPHQAGWDWFSLHLSDSSEVMFYQIRSKAGKTDPASQGAIIQPNGEKSSILATELQITPMDYWVSPVSKIKYPSGWHLTSPKHKLALTITPYIKNQELNQTVVTYWEGAVKVDGVYAGKKVTGSGYVELAGYTRSGS
jgi:predicted secreted hydrolase